MTEINISQLLFWQYYLKFFASRNDLFLSWNFFMVNTFLFFYLLLTLNSTTWYYFLLFKSLFIYWVFIISCTSLLYLALYMRFSCCQPLFIYLKPFRENKNIASIIANNVKTLIKKISSGFLIMKNRLPLRCCNYCINTFQNSKRKNVICYENFYISRK